MFRACIRLSAPGAEKGAQQGRRWRRVVIPAFAIGGAACIPAAAQYITGQGGLAPKLLPVRGADLPTERVQHGEYDVAVVGGGIIGLATAVEIRKRFPKMSVVVLEKESEVAAHQSGHNSGVIHAGMYYVPGTVMAKCCVEGAQMIYEYAEKKGIPYKRVGKLICAPTEAGHAQVEELYRRGVANGVKGLRILNREQVKELEPNVDVHSALESPNTGIIDYGDVSRSLAKDFLASGKSAIRFRYQVTSISATTDASGTKSVEVCGVEPGQRGPLKFVTVKNVLTCGGLHMDHLSRIAGGSESPKVMTFRGRYYQMKPEYRNIVKRNVYPVPSGGGIPVGVHFTPTIGGYRQEQMIIGPGACMAFAKEGYSFWDVNLRYCWEAVTNIGFWRFGMSNISLSLGELWKDANSAAFLAEAKKLVPGLTDDMVEDSFVGVMAQVFLDDGSAAKDYIFERNCVEGTTLNLRNAPSPAATSSMAIAREMVDRAQEDFGWTAR